MQKVPKLLILWLFFPWICVYGQGTQFSQQQVSEDLYYLKKQLLCKHPNIFIYGSKSSFHDFFDKIDIPASLTEAEAYSLITSSSAIIKDGHTLFYPNPALIAHNNEQNHFLPLQVFWDGKHLFVQKNNSSSPQIPPGTKILSINSYSNPTKI